MLYYIKADQFFYPYDVKKGGYLEIKDGKFGEWMAQVPENAEVVDYSGQWIAPGLVDTHIHGFGGADSQDAEVEGIMGTMSEGLLSAGVTSFFPTPLTDSHEGLLKCCEVIGEHYAEARGAKVRGIFFEGPFFTEEHKGAQNPKYMRDAKMWEIDDWQKAAHGMLKKVGLAPERDGSEDFIRKATQAGVKIALGHSNATYKEAVAGIEAGASIWIHTFNGMSGLTHKEPGMVGAILNTPNTYAELICDGHHVRPEAAEIVMKMKGADHVVLITDSMRAAGLPDGPYMLGEFEVEVRDGAAWLPTGRPAASILTLSTAVKNVVDWGIATPAEAVMMGSLTPAKSVGLDDVCGQIKTDYAADFIVLNQDMSLAATYLDGKKRYQA
ncbi:MULTISPECIES: N-acetylglucosamine-6-phosphate deacetylase [unclassified Lactococcus]|uniref:N-acetylglucosamine-6-phosphate deacetylase n=1 Tax=unclassified Lactococcus TaxID=2643510 RepID=UPI0011C77F00|nr:MULTISPECIES: N-acetylglucosamine-6-phosphate deacetylase [unclassified Lactococcus]MQW23850.1 N-acetylglucosamine-6-phosphate deacetylase [Lactococcus sp. dk101]TXK37218.1 N-acetylglucosamine-6-phosphate deacetylase [Lactococcus sp. dk310]TXK48099.1 N-acetylglucosamine-6-phosphate deacetylase [Lactococcus sp. dk322]